MSRVMLSLAVAMLVLVGTAWANDGTTPAGTNNTTPTQVQTQNQNQNQGQNWTPNQNYTRNQVQKWVDEFNAKNLNKDGKLTWNEFKGTETNAKQIAKLQQIFKTMDTKNYGYVTVDQYKTYWMNYWTKMNKKTGLKPTK
jgi:hypothetical protein